MAKVLLLGASGLLGSAFKDFFLMSKDDLAFYPTRSELDVLNYNDLKTYIKNVSHDCVIVRDTMRLIRLNKQKKKMLVTILM
jgi:dTDP-4-dehydrorhamnose reductase